jgi:hypothetical protein
VRVGRGVCGGDLLRGQLQGQTNCLYTPLGRDVRLVVNVFFSFRQPVTSPPLFPRLFFSLSLGRESASDSTSYTFSGGVTPGTWGGEAYHNLKPAGIKSISSLQVTRLEGRGGGGGGSRKEPNPPMVTRMVTPPMVTPPMVTPPMVTRLVTPPMVTPPMVTRMVVRALTPEDLSRAAILRCLPPVLCIFIRRK